MRQETFPDCLGYRFNRYFPAIDRKGVGDAGVAENFGKDFGMLVSPFIIGQLHWRARQSSGLKLQGIFRAGKSYGVVIRLLHESQKAGEPLAVEHAKRRVLPRKDRR